MDLSDNSQRAASREDCTSEISAILRVKVKAIFKSEYGDEDAGAEEDRQSDESDVQWAVENHKGENIEMERKKREDRRE